MQCDTEKGGSSIVDTADMQTPLQTGTIVVAGSHPSRVTLTEILSTPHCMSPMSGWDLACGRRASVSSRAESNKSCNNLWNPWINDLSISPWLSV